MVDPEAWVRALRYGLQTVMKYGGAEPGDRTMVNFNNKTLLGNTNFSLFITKDSNNVLKLIISPPPPPKKKLFLVCFFINLLR